ncbi:hypothetical protein AMS68_007612 [Peltaster fructicola]|uniref:Peripheral subunit-binding (PSBD) domain-containing protein n=1 Tax=Peltaster fructicola TaxID=286661 RepID=A0A6H0Y5B6_9PEZI|nr:hypothetical protein AMS68_007612 [Peltaster fructicola]
MAKTGSPLIDIDIQGEPDIEHENEPATEISLAENPNEGLPVQEQARVTETKATDAAQPNARREPIRALATPAVRSLIKEHNLKIEDVQGTGRDGRVLREDIHRHIKEREPTSSTHLTRTTGTSRQVALTPVQSQMFKVMTRSLSIPHFLYSCSTDMSRVTTMRKRLNIAGVDKITSFAIVVKAASMAIAEFEILNASLDTSEKPMLTYHTAHDFGIAVDTPSGLLVPVLRNVQELSIKDIAVQIRDISDRARNHKLVPTDLSGATFTLSNIGSIGGGVVSPVISAPQVAILGIGRSKIVPTFNDAGELCKREELIMSWSADHRVVDGAQCARCAERVRELLETPEIMLSRMR